LWANTILPQTVGRVCLMTNTPWGHVSSGSVYAGAKVVENGRLRIEKDLSLESLQQLFRAEPDRFYGFGESDEPNSSFRHAPCSFYSGTKALAEEAIGELGQSYIWRPHLPFNEQDEPCNWLSELQRYPTVCDQLNSVSHLDDCIRACLDLWERRAPYGIYHVANPGPVSTRQVMEMIQRILKPSRSPEFTGHDGGNGSAEPLVARTGCLLDVSKMIAAGVKMRSAQDAIGDALDRWRPAVMRPLRIPNRTAEVLPATG
jgi:nucleoside-diphosphate-sugar epimerase